MWKTEYNERQYEKLVLRVCVILDVNEVVGHGLVGQLMQDGADGVKASFHYQQLGLSLCLLGGGELQTGEYKTWNCIICKNIVREEHLVCLHMFSDCAKLLLSNHYLIFAFLKKISNKG